MMISKCEKRSWPDFTLDMVTDFFRTYSISISSSKRGTFFLSRSYTANFAQDLLQANIHIPANTFKPSDGITDHAEAWHTCRPCRSPRNTNISDNHTTLLLYFMGMSLVEKGRMYSLFQVSTAHYSTYLVCYLSHVFAQ